MQSKRALTKIKEETAAQALAAGKSWAAAAKGAGLGYANGAVPNKVTERAREIVQTKFDRANISGDRVMTELARLAFATAKDMFDPVTGDMIPIHEMSDDVAATITGFDVEHMSANRAHPNRTQTVTKVKRGDKLGALNILAKHFKLVNDEDGVNALAGALADRLNAARKRIIETPMVDEVVDVPAAGAIIEHAPIEAETKESSHEDLW